MTDEEYKKYVVQAKKLEVERCEREATVKRILFDKLKEMSKIKFSDEMCYTENCRIMNDIAITLVEKLSKDDN